MANENIDECLIAHCNASISALKIANQDFYVAKKLAELAYEDFKRLEMSIDQEKMKLLIQSLEEYT